GSQDRAAIEPIAELAAARLFGPTWSAPLSVAIGFILLGSVSALLLTGPRVLYAMARAGQFPAAAGRLSGVGRTPATATAMLAACALAMLWTGTAEGIIVYAGVGLAILSMLSVGSLFVLRWRQPDLPRPFRTPGYPVVPV